MRVSLRDKDVEFLSKIWRSGIFESYEYFGSGSIVGRLVKLGILVKVDSFKWIVDRARYSEILDQMPRKFKQMELFDV